MNMSFKPEADGKDARAATGYRQVLIGPAHPYIAGGLPMDFPSVGHGQGDFFTFQARAMGRPGHQAVRVMSKLYREAR
jgi:hypothetical protein